MVVRQAFPFGSRYIFRGELLNFQGVAENEAMQVPLLFFSCDARGESGFVFLNIKDASKDRLVEYFC